MWEPSTQSLQVADSIWAIWPTYDQVYSHTQPPINCYKVKFNTHPIIAIGWQYQKRAYFLKWILQYKRSKTHVGPLYFLTPPQYWMNWRFWRLTTQCKVWMEISKQIRLKRLGWVEMLVFSCVQEIWFKRWRPNKI